MLIKSKQLFNDAIDLERNLAQGPKPADLPQPPAPQEQKVVEPAKPNNMTVAAYFTVNVSDKKSDGASIAQQVIQRMMQQKKEKE